MLACVLQLIPISDANPTRRFPAVTVALIVLNVVAFIQEPGLGMSEASTRYFYENAPVPCQMVDQCPGALVLGRTRFAIPDLSVVELLRVVVFSTFLHAGFMHIAGNMLFLWVFGNNVEDHLGRVKYVAFYLLGGIAASLAHMVWSLRDVVPVSDLGACTAATCSAAPYVPSVGASGAVAAVMGAYLLLFPRARVNVLVPIFFLLSVMQMSAWVVLVLWFLYQFLIAAQELSGATEVAWMAHVGGFVFGAVAIFLLGGRPQRPQPVMWRTGWRY